MQAGTSDESELVTVDAFFSIVSFIALFINAIQSASGYIQ